MMCRIERPFQIYPEAAGRSRIRRSLPLFLGALTTYLLADCGKTPLYSNAIAEEKPASSAYVRMMLEGQGPIQ